VWTAAIHRGCEVSAIERVRDRSESGLQRHRLLAEGCFEQRSDFGGRPRDKSGLGLVDERDAGKCYAVGCATEPAFAGRVAQAI
jgi:hypothetical protein